MLKLFFPLINMITNLIKQVTGLGTTKMVLIVRTDLKMGPGKIASQCAHAAIMLYHSALTTGDAPLTSWMLSGQPKVVLKVNSESKFEELHKLAKDYNLHVCVVCDAGRTQVDAGTATVLGIGPNKVEDIDRITKDLKLL